MLQSHARTVSLTRAVKDLGWADGGSKRKRPRKPRKR
jgi:hypothetical protein